MVYLWRQWMQLYEKLVASCPLEQILPPQTRGLQSRLVLADAAHYPSESREIPAEVLVQAA